LSWQPAVAGLSLAVLVYLGINGRRAPSAAQGLTILLQRRIRAASPPPDDVRSGGTWPAGRHWDAVRRLDLALPVQLTGPLTGWALRSANLPPVLSQDLIAGHLTGMAGLAAGCGCVLGTLAVSAVWRFVTQTPAPAQVVLGVAVAGTGGGALIVVLDVQRQATLWRRRLLAGLPEFVSLLAAGLRGGLDVRRAWTVAGDSVQGPLRRLCDGVAAQLTAGRPFGTAVVDAGRAAAEDTLTEMAVRLVEADAVGAPVVPSLEALAESIRQADDARRMAHLARLPVQMSLCCTLLILPAVLLVAVLPNVLRFLAFLG